MRRTIKGDYSNSKPVKAPAKKFSATFTIIHIITLKFVLVMDSIPVLGVTRLKLTHEYTKVLKQHFHQQYGPLVLWHRPF